MGGLITMFFFIALIGFVGQTVATTWLTEIDRAHSMLETEKEKLSAQRTRHLEDLHERVLDPMEASLEAAVALGRKPITFQRETAAPQRPAGFGASPLAEAAEGAPYAYAIAWRDFRALDARPDDPLWQDALRHFPKLERLSEVQKNIRRLRGLADQMENQVAPVLVPTEVAGAGDTAQGRAFGRHLAARSMSAYLARKNQVALGTGASEHIAAETLCAYVEASSIKGEFDDLAGRVGALSRKVAKTAGGLLPIVRAYRAYHKLDHDCPFTTPSGLHGLLNRLDDEA